MKIRNEGDYKNLKSTDFLMDLFFVSEYRSFRLIQLSILRGAGIAQSVQKLATGWTAEE
jgi:hypothetical protein